MDKQDVMGQSGEIVDLLTLSPFAGPLRNGAPLLVVGGEPARLAYCSRAAIELFGAKGPDDLSSAILTGDSQGARRLRDLAARPPEGPPRLELLRFFTGRMPIQIG